MPMTEDQRASIRLQVAGLVLGTAPDVLRFDTAKLIERADKVFEWVTAAPAESKANVSTMSLVKQFIDPLNA